MKKYQVEWIQEWCASNGWTDLFVERYHYWAFPPGAVIPQPIPLSVMDSIKQHKGLSFPERVLYGLCMGCSVLAVLITYWLRCPLPLVGAFTLSALGVAYLDD